MNKIKKIIHKNKNLLYLLRLLREKYYCILTIISPKLNTKVRYKSVFKRKLDLNNVKTLNEKLLYLKLNNYNKNPLVIQCVDKYAVREYVKKCGCEEILNELYGVYDNPNEIPWRQLPNKFVIKWNFGAGYNIICQNKNNLNIQDAIKKLRRWKREKCWLLCSEMQYKYIPKKIICEKFIEGKNKGFPEDYKVYCFNGKPYYIMLCIERETGHPKFYFFDTEWQLKGFNKDSVNAPNNFFVEKPLVLDKMLEYAKILSKPFPFVRVDFYINGDIIVFGELTFTPAGALYSTISRETDSYFGSLLKI